MKEFFDVLSDFLKKIMQPFLTVAVVIVFMAFALSGKFTSDQVFQIVCGVILFWFGYTAFKFGIPKSEDSTKSTTDLIDIIRNQQSTIAAQSYDLGESVPVKALDEPTVTTTANVSTAKPVSNEPSMTDVLAQAAKEAKAEAE